MYFNVSKPLPLPVRTVIVRILAVRCRYFTRIAAVGGAAHGVLIAAALTVRTVVSVLVHIPHVVHTGSGSHFGSYFDAHKWMDYSRIFKGF